MERESMEVDVLIIGGGPAGLSASIRLMQLAQEKGVELSVCVLEKGSEIGAHILSGAVMEPRAITELFPNWQDIYDEIIQYLHFAPHYTGQPWNSINPIGLSIADELLRRTGWVEGPSNN